MVESLLPHLRDFLVVEGAVRKPDVAGSLPPLWLQPRLGVPAPGEKPVDGAAVEIGPTAVLGAFRTNGLPPRSYESFFRKDFVDFRIRTDKAPTVEPIEDALREALLDKRDWDLAGLRIIESLVWRELQPLGSDNQSFDWVISFTFERYSGLPG